MTERVAVVIPYFQRQSGLLARALRSVFSQTGPVDPLVFVVDDSSPVPADTELASLDAAHREAVRLIRQPNGGAGSARNAALDAVPREVPYAALLDPDDIWMRDHLIRAVGALRSGADFYFAGICREGDTEGHLSYRGIRPDNHQPLGSADETFAFSGDFFDQSLRHSPVATSTVVLRRSSLGHLRFSKSIRPVGEDLLFWLEVARATEQIAFGTRIAAIYGEGINGSWSSDWAAAKAMVIINAYGEYYEEVHRRFALSPEQARLVHARIRQFQVHFAYTLFGMLKRGRWPDPALVRGYLRRNPRTLAVAPLILASRLAGRRS